MAVYLTISAFISTCLYVANAVPKKSSLGYEMGELNDMQGVGIKGRVIFADKSTILLKNFVYEYPAPDMYFWADHSKFTENGLKIPSKSGLDKLDNDYKGSDVTLKLPSGKSLKDYNVFGMYCKTYACTSFRLTEGFIVNMSLKQYFMQLVNKCNGLETSYALFLSHRPIMVMVLTSLISITLTSLGLFLVDIPKFTHPTLGFETHGTDFSRRISTFETIEQQTSINEDYSKRFFRRFSSTYPRPKNRNSGNINFESKDCSVVQQTCYGSDVLDSIDLMTHVVLQYRSTESLFNVDAMNELNSFLNNVQLSWRRLFGKGSFASEAERVNFTSLSIAKIVPCLVNQSADVNKADIERAKTLLASCAIFFEDLQVCYSKACSNTVDQKRCSNMPLVCQNPIIYHTFKYFLSFNAFPNLTSQITPTSDQVYVLIVLPIERYEKLSLISDQSWSSIKNDSTAESYLNYDEEMIDLAGQLKYAKMVALDMGIESELFQKSLMLDARLLVLGLILVSVIIWLYSSSLFYTIAVFFTLLYSVGIAYFVYRFVFRINFFPFMNLLVFALLIGIGADDTFVLYHVYYMYTKKGGVYGASGSGTPRDPPNRVVESSISNGHVTDDNTSTSSRHWARNEDIADAFSTAALSMFLTSATTAAGFFANYVSKVASIKCFSLFAGSVMLTNYLVVVSWLPACLTFYDFYILPAYKNLCARKWLKFTDKLAYYGLFVPRTLVLETLLPYLIKKFKRWFVFVFVISFVSCCLIILQHVALTLPEKDFFQLLRNRNFVSWYNDQLSNYFRFAAEQKSVDIVLVWGFNPNDVGTSLLDPTISNAEFQLKDTFDFNLRTVKSLDKICRSLNAKKSRVNDYCFTSAFLQWSSKLDCSTNRDFANASMDLPVGFCCNYKHENFDESSLGLCVAEATKYLHSTDDGGPLFRTGTFDVQGFLMHFDQPCTKPFNYADFFAELDSKISKSLSRDENAIITSGWYVTNRTEIMQIRDLQVSLLQSTPIAVLISLFIALVVIVLLTRNLLLGIFAVSVVLAVILATIACLVLFEWQLNVVESTVVVMTAGISFDFVSHYVAAYQLTPDHDRDQKVFFTLTYAGLPVFLSALTTFLVGSAVVASSTTAFYKIGVFMMVVSSVSWFWSTFFLLSMLALWGPEYDENYGNGQELVCYIASQITSLYLRSISCLKRSCIAFIGGCRNLRRSRRQSNTAWTSTSIGDSPL